MNKKNLAIVFILFFTHNVFSQDTLYEKNLIWIGEISNGKRNGYCQEYKNDTLLSQGYFKNDIKEGDWIYYGLNGGKYPEIDVIAKGKYKKGKKVGLWEHYQELLYWKGMYKNGLKQGTWNYYDLEIENPPIIIKGIFVNDMPEGKWQYFFVEEETGITNLATEGTMHKGCLIGTWKTYHWASNQLRSVGEVMPDTNNHDTINKFDVFVFLRYMYQLMEYYNDADVNKTGVWNYYHPEKQLDVTGLYANGKKEGVWIYYHENGNMKEKGIYVNGIKEGEWRNYHYDNGTLTSVETFLNDTLNGYCKYVCSNYKSSVEGMFIKGMATGEWKSFYNDSILFTFGHYNGSFYPDYSQMEYFKQTCDLFSANRHGHWKIYFTNGNIAEEGEYINGKKEGEWRRYASEGYLTAIENYKNDNLHGEYVDFNWYGKFVWHYGSFENGEKVNWIEYEKGEGPTKEEYLKSKDSEIK